MTYPYVNFGQGTQGYPGSNLIFSNQAPAPQQGGINWVQGEAGAKAHLVGAGQSVLLMDSEAQCFYIKSTDASGMPMPLRTFDYKERITAPASDSTNYVTREEFDRFVNEIRGGSHESSV